MIRGMKRAFALLCIVMSLSTMAWHTAYASEMNNMGENEVHPMFTSIDNVYCGLTANNGTANIYGSVNGKVGQVTKCKIQIQLQKKTLLWWTTVETWSKTEMSDHASIYVTHAATSGTTYRAVATITVWSGNTTETTSATSQAVKAP